MDTLDVTAMLAPERAVLLDLLRELNDDDWCRPTECPAWDVKGLALHILGDDLSLLSRQRDGAANSLALFAESHPGLSFRELLDGFNEQWVSAAHFFSPAVVIEQLAAVGEASDIFYREVGLATMSREPVGFFASADPSPYWQVIAREYAERFIHQSQIRRALDRPELDGMLVEGAARVVVHALAAWLRNYAPPTGTAIAIDFGRAGAWTWQRNGDQWSAMEGADGAAAARITVDRERVVALLSRGLSDDEARHAIHVEGDAALAAGALDMVAPLIGRPQP